MSRATRYTSIAGACAAVMVAAGYAFNPAEFLSSYLFAFLFCVGLSLGAMANLMLHELTGGRWGLPIRRPWTAATRLVPLNIVLFIPLLCGLPLVYHWVGSSAPDVSLKHWWLNRPFFLARAAVYLLIWAILAWRWLAVAARTDEMRPPALRRWSALGLILYGLTMSLAAVDWIMSLMPQWYSTTFGLLVGTSQMLSGMALGAAACAFWPEARTDAGRLQDFGNLLLMYVMSWAYLAFTQYLIIWAEDLPKETAWFIPRVQTSWRWLTLTVLILQFALPFVLLLSRVVKRAPRYLGPLALSLLIGQLLFNFYLVMPVLKPTGFQLAWSDPLVVIAVVGFWFVAWVRNLNTPLSHEYANPHR
ncbi:MAG: hypothetical protein JSR66_27005 [Proteobacteria bacterium]|nr:hypothetical protein [Pseudomonadota bacterium]